MKDYRFDFSGMDREGTDSLKWSVKNGELPMWVADMDFATHPAVIEAVKRRAAHGIYAYTEVPEEWYEAYIGHWKRRHNFEIDRQWLAFATGVVPTISSAVKRLTNIGDNVVVMTPVYNIFFNSIENAGRHALESRLAYQNGEFGIDFDDLAAKLAHPLSTLLILCDPHNPVGKVFSAEELKRIAELCHRYGVKVISDEIHCDIVQGEKYVPFASISDIARDISVTCISASKAFNLAGLQSSAVVIPNRELYDIVVRGLNSDEVAEPNCFACISAIAALEEGDEWLDALNAVVAKNKRLVYDALDRIDGVRTVKSNATYLVFADLGELMEDTDEFCDHLREHTGLILCKGSSYRGIGKRFVRINVATSAERVKDGISRFERGLAQYLEYKRK